MTRIRYYGPSMVLMLTVVATLIAGPFVMRDIAGADQRSRIQVTRGYLSKVSGELGKLREAFRGVAQVVGPSVVHISVSQGVHTGSGSGWVYDNHGHIITNNHVIANASRIVVKFADKTEHEAVVVGYDAKTDIAVLKINARHLQPAQLADLVRYPVEQGDLVFAFGSPLQYEFSMTQGIVSGIGRRTGALGPGGYEDFIQTDAAINPGNSGGPLTDIAGNVIGMNTMIGTRTETFSGIGLAIPVDMIQVVVDQLIAQGRVRRGYLGVWVSTDPNLLKSFGVDDGILIDDAIADGPAAEAGLKRGDVILSLDGRRLKTLSQFRRTIARQQPGSVIMITIWRHGKKMTVRVQLGEQPMRIAGRPRRPWHPNEQTPEFPLRRLGIEKVQTLDAELAKLKGIEYIPGVLVEQVMEGSAAYQEHVRAGVIITQVEGEPVISRKQLLNKLNAINIDTGVRLSITEAGRSHYVLLKPED